MPSTERRIFLGSLGTVALGGLAGCSVLGSDEPPAGSLRFRNDDTLPHSISVRVTGVGARPGGRNSPEGDVAVTPEQRNLSASATAEPDSRRTYESVFTESVWYGVEFTVDGREPSDHAGETVFHPAPPDREHGFFLSGTVYDSGEFSWGVSSTQNAGRFTFGGDDGT
ncbi:hypothetical protein [Halorussus sp. MSC15.2]|uniref:hypothetical protein n=1 Tax=Halorussus sp. MSC15.2 TaxID=2283638 RepID=UPI0013D37592|nr:hypothetical protein [Halorussus sp. MSC15.2]NEU56238.1 hypothetical protein [Halorussus sp. MSC15.2]